MRELKSICEELDIPCRYADLATSMNSQVHY
jgi:hypothetical protein